MQEFNRRNRGAEPPLTLIEANTVPQMWIDGATHLDDGEVVRITCFALRHRGGEPPEREVVLRLVMPPSGYAWSLQRGLALPAARDIVGIDGRPLAAH